MATFSEIRSACCTTTSITKIEGGEFPFFFRYAAHDGKWYEVFCESMEAAKRWRREKVVDALCEMKRGMK